MQRSRYRWGALAWLLTLQFFVVETIVALRTDLPYSRADDVISALGAATSPAHALMNASFLLQGVLIAAGALLLGPALPGFAGRAARGLLGGAAIGVFVVGLFPQDGVHWLHVTGAVLYLLGGGLGVIALAYAVRRRSEVVGTVLALLGLVATGMTVFFLADVTEYLGRGGTERAAAYPLPIALAVAGAALWRLAGAGPADEPGRRERREQDRAERERRARERDEALEAAARRPESAVEQPAPGRPTAAPPGDDEDEDPWATPARRRTE